MYTEFKNLPETSRVWIYQSNKRFTPQQQAEIIEKVKGYLEGWAAHGTGLQAGFEIKYERFIVLAVNEDAQKATGCSIDDSVRFIMQLEQEYGITLMDKMNVAFKQGEFVNYKDLAEFRKMTKSGAVGKKTVVFNNLVVNIADYKENWEVEAQNSWHARFFK